MSDLALRWNNTRAAADLAIAGEDFVRDDGLRTAILLSLFTDRRADDGDPLPDGATERRGWWADDLADTPGDKIGSRLWLLERSKQTVDVRARAEDYVREALQWLLDDKVASAVDASVAFLPAPLRGFDITVQITRPKADLANYRFARTWAVEGER